MFPPGPADRQQNAIRGAGIPAGFEEFGDEITMADRIFLASPHMSEEGFELEFVQDAFRKNWIAPLGENVNEFEKSMQAFLGDGHTVLLWIVMTGRILNGLSEWFKQLKQILQTLLSAVF